MHSSHQPGSLTLNFFCVSLLFQTLRTCPKQFRKNCLMRCWTETYKKVKCFSLPTLWLCAAVTPLTRCAYISMQLLWKRGRERNQIQVDNGGVAAWQTQKPPRKLYTITGRLPSTGSVMLLVSSLLPTQCFARPFVRPARRSAFIVCTSCVDPNQPNWVLGISLIPVEWLYFPSAHTHAHT